MTRVIAIVLGLVVVALVLQDAFEVMLLPRRVHRRVRLVRYYFEAGWQLWSRAAGWLPAGTRREHFLSLFGALSMVLLFLLWATALITGFGLVEWALQNPHAAPLSPLPEQLYMSGATFFTLGYGDIVPHSPAARVLSVVEAGTGFGFIAVVIGYLPVLYQLFSRREAHVIQLDGRAGSPPTASTMLSRHAESLGQLDRLLREWEVWASDLLESHLSYPMLVYYRSQHDNQSWLAALTALMDTCALILVGIEGLPPLQARMTFTMARQVVVEMARSLGAKPSPYTGGDRLAPADCRKLAAVLQAAGVRWAGGAEAERTLAALRATYEPLLQGLAVALLLPLPGWIAADDAIDHWHEGHRGQTAGRLIEELSERPARPAA
jgi:hypothetical protein